MRRAGFPAIRAAWLVVVLTFVGAGCGSDGGDSSAGMSSEPASATATSTDTSQTFPSSARPGKPIVPPGPDVKNAVTAVLVSGVPSLACDRYVTRNFVRTIFGSRQGSPRRLIVGRNVSKQ